MIIRKLEQSEHIATRKLWEEIFPEDTKAFLDYYYYIKAAKNQIYVVEEDGRICSMLQLNPYRIRLEDKSFPSEYIVAVATKKEYRSRGYMRALLNTVLERMAFGKSAVYIFNACGRSEFTDLMILDIFMTNACKKSKKMRQQMIEIVKVSRRKKERLNFQMRDCGTQKRWQIFLRNIFRIRGKYMLSEIQPIIRR